MAKFGDYVTYEGNVFRIVAVSDDAEPTYTLEPVRRSEETLTTTVTSSQKQFDLVPSGGATIDEVTLDEITPIGSRTAMANAPLKGQVRVRFASNGGSAVPHQDIDDGAKAVQPTPPTREHYTFDGWYTDDETFQNAVNFTTKTFAADTTLYAKWVAITFTVTYNSKGGSSVSSETVVSGETAEKPTDPTKVNYLFAGWFTDDGTLEDEYDFDTPVGADITLYAKWVESVTVTFESNGGSEVAVQVIPKGGKAEKPTDPTKDDYTFGGWFTDDGTFSLAYDFEDAVDRALTLYAKWDEE